jgi:SAM-dependent methyltransferase
MLSLLSSMGERLVQRRPHLITDLRSAYRTGLYGLGGALLRGKQQPPTAAQRQVLWELWREAYTLQRDMLRRPGMAQVLHQVEKLDHKDFPLFALSLPLDLWRASRKRRGATRRVRPPDSFPYPAYYLHDFHNQANGGLSQRAAATYEWQIRLLFAGTNRVMRQAVIDQLPCDAQQSLLDVGCGTAAWLPQARLQGRMQQVCGIDLSPTYLQHARRHHDPRVTFVQANAETYGAEHPETYDTVVCIWLYHELPAQAQVRVTQSIADCLKPGGRLIFMEAIQACDRPNLDIHFINERFAQDFDEPHYAAYQALNLPEHFAAAGLKVLKTQQVFMSKLMVLHKDH